MSILTVHRRGREWVERGREREEGMKGQRERRERERESERAAFLLV